MRQKFLPFLLAIITAYLPASAYDFMVDGLCYNINEDGTSVTVTYQIHSYPNPTYNDLSGEINIPASVTYNGNPYSVTVIGDYAFSECNGLTSVTIPESVTIIGRDAFCECTSMTSIEISNSVTTINERAFYLCRSLENIIIPNSVTEIGRDAFNGCSGMTSVIIGNSVTEISGNAFWGCTSLTSITLPSSVTTIGGYAFYHCDNMATITIPPSVTSIGMGAFDWCSSLIRVNITDLAAWCRISFENYFSNPLIYAHKLYLNGRLIKDLVIPESIVTINDYAFYECSALQSVAVGNDVKFIGNYAFVRCTGLTSATIGDMVERIGTYAFSDCSGLTNLTVGESVNSVDRYSFTSCNSLETVNWNAKNCKDLPSAFFPNSSGITTFNFGDQVLRIPGYLCYGLGNLTDVEIPATVTTIGDNAFRNCTSLESLALPDAVTSVNKEAFRGCSGLKNLKIGESVSLLHNYAFGGCTSLETIVSMAEPTTMTMGTSVFENVPTETCVLKVPQQYYEDYICTEQWEDFFNIEAIAGDTVNGDVDGDGAVTSADVTIIYNYLLGGEAANIDSCDVDGDGFITSTDITVLYNIILGN